MVIRICRLLQLLLILYPIRSMFYANIVNSGIVVKCELITCRMWFRIGKGNKYERCITIFQSVGYYNTLISQS